METPMPWTWLPLAKKCHPKAREKDSRFKHAYLEMWICSQREKY